MTDRLDHAVRAVREAFDGGSGDTQSTLARILHDVRAVGIGRRKRLRAGLLLAAALGISTAAAAHTGRLPRALFGWLSRVSSASGDRHAQRAHPRLDPAPASAPETPAPLEVAAPPVRRTAPAAPVLPLASSLASPAKPEAAASVRSSDPPTDDAMYARAHRLHFHGDDPVAALAALEAYLRAFPRGRFGPEARYNRAIDLIKLRRFVDARAALEPFANGAEGEYHRDDARALLRSTGSR